MAPKKPSPLPTRRKKVLSEKQKEVLKKNKAKQWEKGQSGNIKGKPPGTRNRETIVREFLELALRDADGKKRKNPINPKGKALETVLEGILAVQAAQALKGSTRASEFLFDSGFGKIKETKVIENPDGSALNLGKDLTAAEAARIYMETVNEAKKR